MKTSQRGKKVCVEKNRGKVPGSGQYLKKALA